MKLVLHKISKPKKPTPKDIANKIIKKERRRQLKANRKLKAEKKLKIVPIKIKGKIITEVENPKTKKQENKKIAENFFNNQITNLKDTKHFLDRQQERIGKKDTKILKVDIITAIMSNRIRQHTTSKCYKVYGTISNYILSENLEIITTYKNRLEYNKKQTQYIDIDQEHIDRILRNFYI